MTEIQWTDRTWNPVRGCSLVSAGCSNCYAMKQAHRFSGKGQPYEGLTKLTSRGPVWTGSARFVPEMLTAPLSWKKPQRVFVNSMSDLFHDDITNEQIAAVFGVMASCPQHTFQILTKRPLRMRQWFEWVDSDIPNSNGHPASWYPFGVELGKYGIGTNEHLRQAVASHPRARTTSSCDAWPLANVHLGVSVENQETASRILHLIDVPAVVRFVSAEPLVGPLDLTKIEVFAPGGEKDPHLPGVTYDALSSLFIEPDELNETPVDWVIVGGESGPGARLCDVEWIESIVKQCADAGTPCFVKQLGAKAVTGVTGNFRTHNGKRQFQVTTLGLADRKGGEMSEWPEHLRVRQFPEATK